MIREKNNVALKEKITSFIFFFFSNFKIQSHLWNWGLIWLGRNIMSYICSCFGDISFHKHFYPYTFTRMWFLKMSFLVNGKVHGFMETWKFDGRIWGRAAMCLDLRNQIASLLAGPCTYCEAIEWTATTCTWFISITFLFLHIVNTWYAMNKDNKYFEYVHWICLSFKPFVLCSSS